ncbi:hypothetical protein D3C83_82040 [compost metagenome]
MIRSRSTSNSRGTTIMKVGRASSMLLPSLSRPSANQMSAPSAIGRYRPAVCSSAWLKGRNDKQTSEVSSLNTASDARTLLMKLRCERIAPLGSPVVPEV